MTRLAVCGIGFSYDGRRALEGISFELGEGEFAAVLGPNGSGKTTLLRTMTGILKPKVGAVYVEGKDFHRLGNREAAKLVALVPQESAISFEFTALDIVLMGRYPYARRFSGETINDLKKTRHAMELTDCWQFSSRNINELSSGEKQKVIIARALAQEPKVLLLDEPTSHLDLGNQIEVVDLMKRLCRDANISVLSVFHDLNLASRSCTKAIMMSRGSILASGPVERVLVPERIREVYGVEVEVVSSNHGSRFIVPIGQSSRDLEN